MTETLTMTLDAEEVSWLLMSIGTTVGVLKSQPASNTGDHELDQDNDKSLADAVVTLSTLSHKLQTTLWANT